MGGLIETDAGYPFPRVDQRCEDNGLPLLARDGNRFACDFVALGPRSSFHRSHESGQRRPVIGADCEVLEKEPRQPFLQRRRVFAHLPKQLLRKQV